MIMSRQRRPYNLAAIGYAVLRQRPRMTVISENLRGGIRVVTHDSLEGRPSFRMALHYRIARCDCKEQAKNATG